MEPTPDNLLRETYRLAKENNEMLHRMRRSAFVGGIVKFILYALLLLVPIWFYMTYLNGTVQVLIQDLNRVEGVNTQAQNQFQGFEQAWQQFESHFGVSSATTTPTANTQ
jgi:hypothetical protein